MEDLRIYDFELNLLHIEHNIISSNWNICYNDIGKAEIHLPSQSESIDLLFENKYLVMTQGEKQAIITGRQIDTKCVIYARTPNWILSRRVVPYFDTVSGNTEELLRGFVKEAFDDCDNFVLGDSCGVTHVSELCEKSYTSLFDIVKNALSQCGAGHRVYFDIKNKKWVFEVINGKKRQLEISESGLTSYDSEYLFDMQDYFNCGFYERELTDAEKEAESAPIWEQISGENKRGLYRWEAVLYKTDEQSAEIELSEKKTDEEISAKVRRLKYGTDYNQGDIVNVKFERGNLKRTLEMRISGVNIWDEAGNSGKQPVMEKIGN